MERKMEVKYVGESIFQYQKDIISSGVSDLFLPMSFISGGGQDIGVFDSEGMLPLTGIEKISALQTMDVMISLIRKMIEAEKRYIFIGEYSVREDLVFITERGHEAWLIFRPFSYPNKVSFLSDLMSICKALRDRVPEEERSVVDESIAFMGRGKAGISMILHRMEILRQEAMTTLM